MPEGLTLKSLGITHEELLRRLVDQMIGKLLYDEYLDEDGRPAGHRDSEFKQKLEEQFRAKVDESVETIAGRHVLPNVEQFVEGLVLQKTNKWGEGKGKPVTFVEYLVERAEVYMSEEVNYDGRPKGTDGYSWRAHSTRLVHAVHEHLQYEIDRAMKEVIKDANSQLSKGIQGSVKVALEQLLAKVKCEVKVK